MKVGSLFSGIGGLDLGLERAGMDVIWQSEIDPYACKVLDKHWPLVPNLGNIKEIDWSKVERPDVICGGYPCQPFSQAGKRQGEADARHLWMWVRDCIAELRPRYAVLENVRGHLSLGFGTVLGDLAAIGYDTEWQVLPAAAFGAPHKRERVFIVSYPNSEFVGKHWASSNVRTESARQGNNSRREAHDVSRQWWQVEPRVDRVADGISSRVDRLRCLGNAVVPQVAEYVGRLIMDADSKSNASNTNTDRIKSTTTERSSE